MTTADVAAWLLSLMVAGVPPRSDADRARYNAWATAIAEAAFDPAEQPVFTSPRARSHTAALMLAVARYESGFSDVVNATGDERARLAQAGWNDGGRSWCFMQVMLGKRADGSSAMRIRGWTGEQLIADPGKCARAGLSVLRSSWGHCRHLPYQHRLAAYASGACWRGHRASARRVSAADLYLSRRPADWLDADLAPPAFPPRDGGAVAAQSP